MNEQSESWTVHRGAIRNYFDLTAWQKARRLVKTVYDVSQSFPREEAYD